MVKLSQSDQLAIRLEAIVGEYFSKSPAQVKETVRENMRRALMATAEQGRDIVKSVYPVGKGTSGGHLRNDIIAADRSDSGTPWALTAVVKSINNQRMPGHVGYTTYIETGVRAGSAVYFSGLRAGNRSGKVTSADRKAVRSGTGFKGYGGFRKAYSVMRQATKLLRANYTQGLE